MEFWEQVDEQDVIVENQRGLTLFGCPCFSAKLLFPRMDPSNFQIMNRQKGTLYDMKGSRRPIRDFYPVDGDDQGGRWLVDMRYGDVDDQGWVYSWAFRHGRWRGKKGIVRRRLWVREKLAPGATIPQPQSTYSKESAGQDAAAKSQRESLTTTLKVIPGRIQV
ncbi:uncharacterized protein ZBIST_3585 [Zygosaccharomyces bailii]|nr:uncharacterized protein ZBIST_3585 [Zygosaccharomyces bailii]